MVRIKKRFIIFQILTDESANKYSPAPEDIVSEIHQPFQEMYGIFGAGNVFAFLKIMFWIPEKRLGVFRVPRDWCSKFKLFLDSIETFHGINVRFQIHHVSGTIDQAQRWIDENNFVIQ